MRRRLVFLIVALSLCGSAFAPAHAQRPKSDVGNGQVVKSTAEILSDRYSQLLSLLERYRADDAKALDELGQFWFRLFATDREMLALLIKRIPVSLAPLAEMSLTDVAFELFQTNQVSLANLHLETVEAFFDWTLRTADAAAEAEADAAHERQFRFANDWYKAIIWLRFARLDLDELPRILERARWRFPGDPEIHFSSAVFEELAFTRLLEESRQDARRRSGGRQSTELTMREARAVRFYRDAIRLDPKNAEARIRLAYLFMMRDGQREEALTLLTEAHDLAKQPPLSYLAALFAGDLEERRHHANEAGLWYRRAIADCPRAQTARLAYSHLLLMQYDDVRPAQNALRPLIGGPQPKSDACEPDPWRMYAFGPAWRLNDMLDRLHKEVREPLEKSSP
jgi:hypothetical protein